MSAPTIGKFIDVWLDDLERLVRLGERSRSTLRNYQCRAKHQLRQLRDCPIAELSIPEIRAWHLASAEQVRLTGGRGAKTGTVAANLALRMLHLIMLRAEEDGAIPRGSDPTQYVARFRELPRQRYLTEAETATLWRAIDRVEASAVRHAKRPKALAYSVYQAFRLIILLALRRGEAMALRWEQVDLEQRVLRLPATKTGYREVALSEPAVQVLREQLRRRVSDWVFPSRVRGRPVAHTYRTWRKILEVSGIDATDVVVHTARHSLATCALRRGEPIEHVSLLLGHSSTKVTRAVYARPLATPGMRVVVDRQGELVRGAA